MNFETLKKLDKKYAQVIADYLLNRIETDQCLKEKLETTNKTLKGCIEYIKKEAKKQAEDNVAVIPKEEVFEWSVHYFLEDSLKENSIKKSTTPATTDEDIQKYNKQPSPKPKKETVKKDAKEKLVEQLTLFDLDF